jgi:hypothetical protein
MAMVGGLPETGPFGVEPLGAPNRALVFFVVLFGAKIFPTPIFVAKKPKRQILAQKLIILNA